MTAADAPIVIATDMAAARIGITMCVRGEARGVIYLEDGPRGVEARFYAAAGPDSEAVLDELRAILDHAAAMDGAIVVDAARLGKRGAA